MLKRFTEGKVFPDSPEDLKRYVSEIEPANDQETLALMARLFDRPAFYTPFHAESSVPAFKIAITDTIEALNTGVHRLRDGTEFRRIPSGHHLMDRHARDVLGEVERKLGQLRAQYDGFLRTGEVRPCGCGDQDCPFFMVSPAAARRMDTLREDTLETFRSVFPNFRVRLGWHY